MIGIDLVSIERIAKASENDHFLMRVFTQSEIDYALAKANSNQTLAGIFAAKEAVVKAVGGNIFEVEVLHEQSGKPFAMINGERINISISHDAGFAIAVAIKLT